MKNREELKKRIRGAVVVMLTPFKKDYEIDWDGLRRLTRFSIDGGIKEGNGVLLPGGSTAEFPMLTDEERREIFRVVKEEARDEVPIIGGCNHAGTQNVIKLVHYAEELGLDGVMISPPYYWKPTEESVITHFKEIGEQTDIGIMLYNNWFASQLDVSVETMLKLIDEVPNIVSIKENTLYLEKLNKMINAVGDKISVISGNGEPNEPHAAFMGADGFIASSASIIPNACVSIYKAETEGDYEKVREIMKHVTPLLDILYGGNAPYDYILRLKAALNIIGLPGGIPRLPLLPVDDELKNETNIKEVIENYKLPEEWNNN